MGRPGGLLREHSFVQQYVWVTNTHIHTRVGHTVV